MSRKGLGTLGMIAVIAAGILLGGFVAQQSGILSATGPSGNGDNVETKDATLNLGAEQLGSSSKIATTAYATFSDGTVVSKSLSSGQFTSWSVFTNKDSGIKVRAFDSSNYPITSTVSFDGSTQLNKVIKTADIAAASEVSMEARETSGASDNDDTLKLAAGGQAKISSLRATVDVQEQFWNVGYIYADTPSNSNVSLSMPNNEQVAVPDSAPSGVDVAWKAYNPSMGDDTFTEFATHDSNRIVVDADDSNDPSETITLYADDVQAYQDSDTGKIAYGAEDGSDTNLGLAEQSLSVTVN